MMRSIWAVIVGLAVSSCGSTPGALPVLVPSANALKAIDINIYATLPKLKISGTTEISPVHKNEALGTIADWAICLRNDTGNGINYFVFLIDLDAIVDYRRAIVLDRCNVQSYVPLPKPLVPVSKLPKN